MRAGGCAGCNRSCCRSLQVPQWAPIRLGHGVAMQGSTPTDATLAACWVLCELDDDLSKTDFADRAGVDRSTVHRWLTDGRAEAAYERVAESPALRRELARLTGHDDQPRPDGPPPVAEPADVIDAVCHSIIEAALWPREALIEAGVPPARAAEWERLARAAEVGTELGELWRRVCWAETRLERELNRKLVDQGGGWQAARELRARRFPERYGNADGGTQIIRPLADVPADVLADVLGL